MSLVTFGCSLTYGVGLDDIGLGWELGPSKLSWPSELAKLMSLDVKNISEPGASNKQIHNAVLNYEFIKDDIVVILWTHSDRFCIHRSEKEYYKIGAWQEKDKIALAFFEHLHDPYDMIVDMYQRILCSKLYLDSIDIKSYHILASNDYRHNFKWLSVDLPWFSMWDIRRHFPDCNYDHHPNDQAHTAFAEAVYNYIGKLK